MAAEYLEGCGIKKLAEKYGKSHQTIRRILQFMDVDMCRGVKSYMPTEEEIRAATAEIRKGWSIAEHFKRLNMVMEPLETPCFDMHYGRSGWEFFPIG